MTCVSASILGGLDGQILPERKENFKNRVFPFLERPRPLFSAFYRSFRVVLEYLEIVSIVRRFQKEK